MNKLPEKLTFEETEIRIIDHNDQPWLTAPEIAKALEYKKSSRISEIYNRHKDEFTEDFSVILDLRTTAEIPNFTRVFSPRGCYLIAMFARTDKAKKFRKWVLDVLEKFTECNNFISSEKEPETVAITKDEYIELLKARIEHLESNPKKKRKAAKPVSDEEVNEMKTLYKTGFSIADISRKLKRSNATVSMLIRSIN